MVLNEATKLGQALVQSDEYKTFAIARDIMDADAIASSLLDNYNYTESKLSELLEDNAAMDNEQVVLLKETLEDLREQIVSNEILSQFAQAQTNFQFLMKQINEVIDTYINPQEESSCSDGAGCSNCSGCNCH